MDLKRPLAEIGMAARRLPVAVIGAGFTGTITALNLLRTLPADCPVLLCERAQRFACGAAYATERDDHLLNVRAANMSAFAEQPDAFEAWLRGCAPGDTRRVRQTAAGVFAARSLYGRYLNAMLDLGMAGVAGSARLRLVADEVVDVAPAAGGWSLAFASGASELVGGVVIAVGNLLCRQPASEIYRADPWAPAALRELRPDRPVLVVGSGLTAIDLIVALHGQGFAGPVVALSRRGLLPHRHAPCASWTRPSFTPAERASVLALLRRVRREVATARAQGVDWRGVVDSLRADTQALWRGLPEREQARFLRHLRPFWDVHRHRLAPPVADRIDALRAGGYVRFVRGRFCGVEEHEGAVHARIRRRGAEPERLPVQRVLNATGVASAAHCDDRLLAALRARGLVRLDPLGLGIEVADTLQVVDARGRAAGTMWALGPVVRGVFWECVAVPDIRVQAAQLARHLAGDGSRG